MRQKKEGRTLRLKLRDLQMLQALAEAGSMAAAAEQLALSQPAISKAMSEMEYGLGAQLLDRSSRGVVLTESGRVLLQHGRVILDEVRLGITEIERLSDPTQGEVRIGTGDPATVVVSEIINALSRRYPDHLSNSGRRADDAHAGSARAQARRAGHEMGCDR